MTDTQVLELPACGSTDERSAFAEIQRRLAPMYARIFPIPRLNAPSSSSRACRCRMRSSQN